MAIEYKYKPYTPTSTKTTSTLSDEERVLKSLQSQQQNLEARLQAAGVDQGDNRNFIEKAFNLKQDQGLLFDVIEVINRPVETVKGAISSAVKGENVLEGAWEGFSGQETITGTELLSDIGVDTENLGGVGKFIVDVGVDIALDPLTYVPGGIFLSGAKKVLLGKKGLTAVKAAKEVSEAALKQTLEVATKNVAEAAAKEAAEQGIKNADEVAAYVTKKVTTEQKRLIREQGYDLIEKTEWDELSKNYVKGDSDRVFRENAPYTLDKQGNRIYARGGRMETEVTDAVGKYLDELPADISDNIVVRQGKAGTKEAAGIARGDLEIFYKLDDGSLFRVQKLEVKDFLNKAAMGKTGAVKVLSDGSIEVGKSIKPELATKLSKTLGKLKTAKKTVGGGATTSFGETVQQLVQKKLVGKSGKTAKSFTLDADDIEVLQEVFGDMLSDSYNHISVVNGAGDLQIYKTSDVLDNVDWGSDVLLERTGNTMRIRSKFKLSKGADITDVTDYFFAETIGTFSDVQQSRGILGFVADRIPQTFKDKVRPIKEAFEKIGYSFNYKKNLGNELIDQLNRIGGEAGSKLQGYSKRLAKITDNIIKNSTDPAAMKKVTEILESGATLTETGVNYAGRRISVRELADNIKLNIAEGDALTLLPEFATKLDADNFINSLNGIYRKSGGLSDGFELIEKNGSYAVRLLDDIDIKDMNQVFGAADPTDLDFELLFGKKGLSPDTEAFWRNNAQAISEYEGLRADLVKMLSQEVGFTNLPDILKGKGGYMRHILSPDAAQIMKKMQPISRSRYMSEGTKLLKERKFLGTVDEINKGLKEFYEKIDVDVFDVNAQASFENLIRVSTESLEQHKVLETVLKGSDASGRNLFTVLDDTKFAAEEIGTQFKILDGGFEEEFSKMFKNLTPETQKVIKEHFGQMGYQQGKRLAVHRSAYNIMSSMNKAYVDIPDFVKGYDKFLNTWKSVTLVSPGFHMRNLFGNMSNSYLVGMNMLDQGRYAKRAMVDIKRYRQVADALASGKSIDELGDVARKSYERVLDFYESGVSQTHKGVRDLDTVKEVLDKGKKNLPNRIVEANFNLAENMDDFQRYMLYNWSMNKSSRKFAKEITNPKDLLIKSRAEAARTVTDALFDYSHLTGFEKEYMKRLFPFYTFVKNNLIFQSKNIVKNPGAYARVGRAYKYATEDLAGISTEDMPDYMAENMWLPIPIKVSKDDKEAIQFLKMNLPVSDFAQLVENPFREGVNFVTTPVKLMFELGTGVDTFTGAQIKEFPGQVSRAEEGVLKGIRDERGTLAISGDPMIQKLANDLGLRVPKNYASVGLDILDTAMGNQSVGEGLVDVLSRFGVTGAQTTDNLELTKLYQDLEQLRYLQDLYEQQTGQKLPSKADFGL